MSSILITIALVIVVIIIGYYLAKRFTALIANAILGLILLFIINFFHLMGLLGLEDLGYSIPTLLISAIGGVVGVAILILLAIFGITV